MIVIATKFGEGAWMVVIAIPVLVLGFVVVGRHYADVRTRLRDPGGGYGVVRGPVVLYVSSLDDATAEALRYVRAIAGDRFVAIHVADPAGVRASPRPGADSPATGLRSWRCRASAPSRAPSRATCGSSTTRPGEVTTLVVPELFRRRSLVAIVRGRTTLALRLRLQGEEDVVLADVPVVADATGLRRPPSGEQKTTVLLPISELNAASRHALGYALGLGAENVHRPARRAGRGRRLADARGLGGAGAAHPRQGRAVAVPRPRGSRCWRRSARSRPTPTPSAWS